MGTKRLRIDLKSWDIWEAGRRIAVLDGPHAVLQDIALELDTFKGDMPLDPQYGCLIKGALGTRRLDWQMLEQEAKRIATKHPDVASVEAFVDEDGTLQLSVRLNEGAGGGSASASF